MFPRRKRGVGGLYLLVFFASDFNNARYLQLVIDYETTNSAFPQLRCNSLATKIRLSKTLEKSRNYRFDGPSEKSSLKTAALRP